MSLAKPFKFTGKQSQHVGRHGIIKPGGVIWLTKEEQEYMASHPHPDFEEISDDQAKKMKLKTPKTTGDNEPVGADTGVQTEEDNAKKRFDESRIAAKREELSEMTHDEVVDLCKQHKVQVAGNDKTTDLIKKLAPVLVRWEDTQRER